MIRSIAAIDEKRGVATDAGIPWRLSGDVAYFRQCTDGSVILMGRATYEEFPAALKNRRNVVLTRSTEPLREGFERATDLESFLAAFLGAKAEDVWVIGGAAVYEASLDDADELLLTQVLGDFHCTKFFPPYRDQFTLADQSDTHEENGVRYRFETWRRIA